MTPTGSDQVLAAKLAVLLPQLDERQRRLLLGAEARALGRGGIARVAAAAGVSRPTVTRGVAEVRAGGAGPGRVRRHGGGRKSLTHNDPGLVGALEALVDPVTRGDPMSPLRWTTKSTRQLAQALTATGHPVSHVRVGELLHALGYSLQANAKTVEGKQHPDRDAQFGHINAAAARYLKAGDPVISVDTKAGSSGRHAAAAADQERLCRRRRASGARLNHGAPHQRRCHTRSNRHAGRVKSIVPTALAPARSSSLTTRSCHGAYVSERARWLRSCWSSHLDGASDLRNRRPVAS